eukprot:CAMPEP_0201583086 /NCGR_PEP_ID=MMETSP0190_2-20130828/94085_1 /ASSEMBLY_ACC=CAM_ASM_000263 /TAXON_ID=37353 /ORGANISM="Rosalina sp." /LENGTH=94 /DNA_ID=CAMNT_0048024283 /DNA_START=32 /DNA_END=313 /DNA_ORIENTATION=-
MAFTNTDMITPLGLINAPAKLVDKYVRSTPLYIDEDNIDRTDEIWTIEVRNAWEGHGLFAAIGSLVTAPLAGSAVTHWWVEIQTTDYDFYIAQW